MNAPPLLTIVIPTVNRLGLLKKALASALAQTVPVEIIVSDNGSSDGTEGWLASQQLPSHVRRFRHTPTMPVQDHGWLLTLHVSTEWTVFLSDDDFIEPDFSAQVTALIDEQPDAAFAFTGCDLIFGDVAVSGQVGPRVEGAADFLYNFMDGKRNICLCATAFRTESLRRLGRIPDDVLIGDMFYWTKILEQGGTVACATPHLSNYYFYRPGMSSETSRNSVANWARESLVLAERMRGLILADPGGRYDPAVVERVTRKFLSLAVSNQFAWNALRGAGRAGLFAAAFRLAGIILPNIDAVIRVAGVLLLPRGILEYAVRARARRMSRTARRGA